MFPFAPASGPHPPPCSQWVLPFCQAEPRVHPQHLPTLLTWAVFCVMPWDGEVPLHIPGGPWRSGVQPLYPLVGTCDHSPYCPSAEKASPTSFVPLEVPIEGGVCHWAHITPGTWSHSPKNCVMMPCSRGSIQPGSGTPFSSSAGTGDLSQGCSRSCLPYLLLGLTVTCTERK